MRKHTFNGKSKTLAEWANEYDIPANVLRSRINNHGWTMERALTTPYIKKHSMGKCVYPDCFNCILPDCYR